MAYKTTTEQSSVIICSCNKIKNVCTVTALLFYILEKNQLNNSWIF